MIDLLLRRRVQLLQAEPSIPNNEIWYTNSIGEPEYIPSDCFNVDLISNTYSDGKGVLLFNGDVQEIINGAFGVYWRYLESMTIPNTVNTICEYAFAFSELTSFTIPSSVGYIGDHAFEGCNILSTFNYLGTIFQWNIIYKGSYWKYNAPFTVVHCSDGDVYVW